MTLPNKITFVRIIFMPLSLVLLYSGQFKWYLTGYILAWFLGLSDFLDGYLARRLGQISILGKIIDPIADKLFVLLFCLYFVHLHMLPSWVLIILLSRELTISDFRLWAQRSGKEVAVSSVGKWKATFQFLLIGYLGFVKALMFSHPGWQGVETWPIGLQIGYYFLLVIALVLTVVSVVEYFWSNRAVLQSSTEVKGI